MRKKLLPQTEISTNRITVSAHVKLDITNDEKYIVSKGHEIPYTLGIRDGKYWLKVGSSTSSNGSVFSLNSFSNIAFSHLIGTYDGSKVNLFVNGTLVNSVNYSGTMVSSSSLLRIGTRSLDKISFIKGQIDDIRIYNLEKPTN